MNIIITNSANIIVGETGSDTLANVIAYVATWEPCEDADGEESKPHVYTDYNGGVWVAIPAHHEDGWKRASELCERVGYLVGSDAQAEAEADE
jgi:hypothetical protein